MENIVESIINMFSGLVALRFGKELIVFFISILPILELMLDHNELFLTPYIGLASIFITDRKEYFKSLPKDRPQPEEVRRLVKLPWPRFVKLQKRK